MIIRNIWGFIVLMALYSCGSSASEENSSSTLSTAQAEVQELQQEVLAIHDEVMPLMGNLMNLKEQVEKENQQLQNSGTADAGEQVIMNSMVIASLDQAHEGMMQWMRAFKKPDLDTDPEAAKSYLEGEKEKILLVQEQVDNAIKAAEATLGLLDS